ncbi:MAG: hypothetical protein ACUVX8_11810 [Candidatus Zipacnadales bacterium]
MRPRISYMWLLGGFGLVVNRPGVCSLDAGVARYRFSGNTWSVTFAGADGSLACVVNNETIWRSGELGLWQMRFQDGSVLNARECGQGEHALKTVVAEGALHLTYTAPDANVMVTVTERPDGVDLSGEITPKGKVVLEFVLPARLRFEPQKVKRFVSPDSGGRSVGLAFNKRFFVLQPQDRPAAWRPEPVGPQGYIDLFGGPLDQRADQDPPTFLHATELAQEWFSEALIARINMARATVNRPSTRAQLDLVLVDSENGPYFAGSTLGGEGKLWRLGGAVRDEEADLAAELVTAVIARLLEIRPVGRTKLGLIALLRGPERGGWTAVAVGTWRERLRSIAGKTGVEYVELSTAREMMQAAASTSFVALLNPYGEWAPVPENGNISETVSAVGEYVRRGGHWFEVGGYPFFYAMQPVRYLKHGTTYPPAFADFFHLDSTSGHASVYRVQPQSPEPWAGAQDHSLLFVPGRLECGGDEQGGYCERPFATYVRPGERWRTPTVRISMDQTVEQDLSAYCEANGIRRRLEDKMRPEVLEKFRNSVLLYYAGSCREKTENLQYLPVPTQLHFADYLKGGFDKEYPDHLPPHPSFGTSEELRAFFDYAHQLGHLVMPYTNPTWWCDHPRGPTFQREGTAPLLKTLTGELSYERYAANDGYTVCHWHPAVRAANARTLRQFTQEYPVDILFQDQCGARSWHYDMNPVSPTPYAYTDGLISMVAEDSRVVPLSTENGWDRVVNYESQLCGMSWSIVPTEGGPSWRRLMKDEVPVETWDIFPLAQYIAHDKCVMLYHDLGQFVTNREVLSWTVGLGFCMSYRVGASALTCDAPREWLRWLDRLQKSVCARYVGEPVIAFAHERGTDPTPEHDGVLRATYGPVSIVANLGPEGRDGLPPYGFRASAPGMVAGNLAGSAEESASFVVETGEDKIDLWLYAPPESNVRVELPEEVTGEVTVLYDNNVRAKATPDGRYITVRTPSRPGRERVAPPPDLLGKAPREWPGERPAIGVIDMGPGITPVWTRTTPGEWVKAFEGSQLAKEQGIPIRRITTVEQLSAALGEGPTRWLAVINPYGEVFVMGEDWRGMLRKIREYVNNGGSWWEVGGYSFYSALRQVDGRWERIHLGPTGMASLGLPVGGGEVDQFPEALRVTSLGHKVLGEALARRVESLSSAVNRGLSRGADDPGHLTLVAGAKQDFIGAYRLDGWGYLWRIGGLNPNPEVALPVVVATMEYLFEHEALPVTGSGVHYLWHATVTTRQ